MNTFKKYQDFYNPTLARLLKFSGLDKVEKRASGALIYDEQGNEYIDCAGGYGVFFIGYSHPYVTAKVKEQLDQMAMSSRVFFNEEIANLAEKLALITPGNLQYSFFCNSGAEAVEGALKFARLATKRSKIIATVNGFHGKTFGGLSASGRDLYKQPFQPLVGDFYHVPFGDIQALEETICEKTAAVILEPIQGEGGIIVPPDDYLPKVREICDKHKVLLILDEVQTGMGRTGKMFCCEHYNVVPDIMTLAKALGGGIMPIGAFIGTKEVWKGIASNPLIHTSTFGGNSLACVAAMATIEVIEKENLCQQACEKGMFLLEKLRAVKEKYPQAVKDVRGKGLMIGVELVKEGYGGSIIFEMSKEKITAVYTLNNPKVIRFEPPAVISYEQLEKVTASFEKAVLKAYQTIK